MKRASQVRRSAEWSAEDASDRVLLDADDRHRRRVVLTGEHGTTFLLDLPEAIALKDGDGLVLDDGMIVRVVGLPEPLLEISAASGLGFVRLAWHLGNRHTDAQFIGEAIRIRRDHVLEEMVRLLGARARPIEAPFDPEPGAHGDGHDGHDHGS